MGAAIRETAAVAGALFAYLTTVLPRVRQELRPLSPLPKEKVRNAEAVAVFATLAPRRNRGAVVRGIVALQVAIDLRDELEEAGEDATDPRIEELQTRWRRELTGLPSYAVVRPCLERAVARCETAQQLTHRAARERSGSLRRWAEQQQAPPGNRWWEVAAGATSSVAAHALIAAAADPRTTAAEAAAIDAAYNPPIGALTVLLDDLVDFEEDRDAGEHNYLGYYEDPSEAAECIAVIARQGQERLAPLHDRPRHAAILAGVLAYYLGSPGQAEFSRAVATRLKPLASPARLLAATLRAVRHLQGSRVQVPDASSPREPG